MPFKNLANTAMAFHGNRLFALWEGGLPYEVSLPELETLGECDFDGSWKHAVSAHPKVDPRTGEFVIFGYSPVAKLPGPRSAPSNIWTDLTFRGAGRLANPTR